MKAGAYGGYVLAGGRSSRMGTDKAMLMLEGRTLLERAASAVESATGVAVIVGDPTQYGKFGYPVIPDHYVGSRTAGGYCSCPGTYQCRVEFDRWLRHAWP